MTFTSFQGAEKDYRISYISVHQYVLDKYIASHLTLSTPDISPKKTAKGLAMRCIV